LAEHYANEIEQGQQRTPLIIAGFFVGGIAALETARILQRRGVSVTEIILIDTAYSSWLLQRTWLWRFSGHLVNTLHPQSMNIKKRSLGALFNDPGINSQVDGLKKYQAYHLTIPVTLIRSSGVKPFYWLAFRP
jgi:hypothetical protein